MKYFSLAIRVAIALYLLFCSPLFAQVIYSDTPEQKKTGIYESVWIIKTDAESGMQKLTTETQDADVKVSSCVEIDDGDCVQSEYFKATITDVKG